MWELCVTCARVLVSIRELCFFLWMFGAKCARAAECSCVASASGVESLAEEAFCVALIFWRRCSADCVYNLRSVE